MTALASYKVADGAAAVLRTGDEASGYKALIRAAGTSLVALMGPRAACAFLRQVARVAADTRFEGGQE